MNHGEYLGFVIDTLLMKVRKVNDNSGSARYYLSRRMTKPTK